MSETKNTTETNDAEKKADTPPAQNNQCNPPRELTQTDKINKKLLVSLFERWNQGGDPVLEKMKQQENDEDDWETSPGDETPK